MAENLFNSTTDPVPPLRYDIELIPVKDEGRDYVYLHDNMGYASPDIVLLRDFIGVLRLFDGRQSIRDILIVLSGNSNEDRNPGYGNGNGDGDRNRDRDGNDVSDGDGDGDGNGNENEAGNITGDDATSDENDASMAANLLNVVRFLDENRLLQSAFFREKKQETERVFEKGMLRPPVCAGTSYPGSPDLIRKMFDEAFEKDQAEVEGIDKVKVEVEVEVENENEGLRNINTGDGVPDDSPNPESDHDSDSDPDPDPVSETISDSDHHYTSGTSPGQGGRIRALYAPHIDIRVGLHVYARAFAPLKNLRPKRVVILATSHYSGMYFPYYDGFPYMVSRKDFETPFGPVSCDRQFCEQLAKGGDEAGVTLRDRSHRLEHSIELHLIFLKYLWDHDFSIVPVLVGPLEELILMENGHQAGQVARFTSRLNSMLDDDTLVLISGDQAHFGRKFGDRIPASDRFDDIREYDRQFLADAARGSADGILEHIRSVSDEFRICGFPPLYTWLKTDANARGKVTAYDLWDERDQESAVSFGSLLFTDQ